MTSVTVEDTSQKAHFYLIEYQNNPNSNNVYLVVYVSIGFVKGFYLVFVKASLASL